MTSPTLLESLLSFASDVFSAHSIVLFATKEGSGNARVRLALSQGDLDVDAVLFPGKGLAGWILRNKTQLVVNAIQNGQGYLTYYRKGAQPAVRSFMGFYVAGMGVVCIDSLEENAFPPEKQRLFASFAAMLAQACAICDKEQEERFLASLEEISSLRRSYTKWTAYIAALLELLADRCGFQFAMFASLTDSTHYRIEHCIPHAGMDAEEHVFSIYSDIIGWTFRNNRSLFFEGDSGSTVMFQKTPLEAKFQSYACLPVSMRSGLCGVLFMGSPKAMTIPQGMRTFLTLSAEDLSRTLDWLSEQYSKET